MKKLTFLVASAALMFAACSEPLQEEAEIEPTPSMLDEHLTINGDAEDTPIVLGEKLNNPYTLDNMRLAIEELNKQHLTKSAIRTDIKPTHYYIKFKPKNEDDINRLESDTTIFFYSYPLDYEIIECGSNYHDPELPADVPTYQYCAVAVDQKLPDVEYEILEELYILEDVNVYEDGKGNCKPSLSKRAKIEYWDELEDAALELAGNNKLSEAETLLKKKDKYWQPGGYLYYYDTKNKTDIALEGVPVHIRVSMFVGHQCCTAENGYFSFSQIKKKKDVTYSIKWKRANFKIRPNTGVNAAETILAKNSKSRINKTFNTSEVDWKYANVFRAAHYYYYKNIDGLSHPKDDNLTLRVCGDNTSINGKCGKHFIGSDIHIYNLSRPSDEIFCTTIHEIGHWVHRGWSEKSFKKCDDILKESWARGASWYITRLVYPTFTSPTGWYERYEYTGIIEDLIDYDNSTTADQEINNNDKVSGYSIIQIERALKGAQTWDDWKNNLKNLYNNGTEKNLDDLFKYWNINSK